jgi:hypothetical protein
MFDAGEGEADVARATRTSSGAQSAPPSPEGKAFGDDGEARVLTLAEIEVLEPFRSVVWIETRPWATQRVTEESEIYRFYLLFEAVFLIFGVPVDGGRRRYHFRYTYSDGRNYEHHRVDEFYGQEWRVWDKKPTDAQREDTKWLNM